MKYPTHKRSKEVAVNRAKIQMTLLTKEPAIIRSSETENYPTHCETIYLIKIQLLDKVFVNICRVAYPLLSMFANTDFPKCGKAIKIPMIIRDF